MTAVMFDRRGETYAVRFSYDPTLVDLLKSTVPSYARRWSPPRREWFVEAIYARELADTLHGLGHTVVGIESVAPRDTFDVSCWAKLLFKRVGPNRSTAVYRVLSKCLHPDVGGDTELQRELNDAHAEISTQQQRRQTA